MIETALSEMLAIARSVIIAVLPLAILFVAFQIFLLKLRSRDVFGILSGTLIAACGLFLFLLGVSIGFLPFGRIIGESLGTISLKWLLAPVGLLLGFFTAWSEPAVRVLSDQVEDASNGSIPRSLVLRAICLGVALWVALGMLRIGYGISLLYLLVPGYGLVLLAMWFCRKDFVAIAVDAGGVATGPMANTFLLALALGASSAAGDQNPIVHGLGLVSLIALAPITSVMLLGILINRKGTKGGEDDERSLSDREHRPERLG